MSEDLPPEADKAEFLAMRADPSWAARRSEYLRSVLGLEPREFSKLPAAGRDRVFVAWLRHRERAQGQLRKIADAGLNESHLKDLKAFAAAGFLGSGLTRALLGDASPAALGANGSPPFLSDPERQIDESLRFQIGMKEGFLDAESEAALIEQAYATARRMTLDPAGWRAERHDLCQGLESAELEAQDALPLQVGHLYKTADSLRSDGRLSLEWCATAQMNNAMADTTLMVRRTRNGKVDWKIRLRVSDLYKPADPTQLAGVFAHELLHGYDYYIRIVRFGAETAQKIHDFVQEEMRAFIANALVDAAYFRAMEAAADRHPYDPGAQTLRSSSRQLRELELIKDREPAIYETMLARLAENLVRERGLAGPGSGLQTIASMTAYYRDQGLKLKSELVASEKGLRGLETEIAAARRRSEIAYETYLLMQKNRTHGPVWSVRRQIETIENILAALRFEQKRGLALKARAERT